MEKKICPNCGYGASKFDIWPALDTYPGQDACCLLSAFTRISEGFHFADEPYCREDVMNAYNDLAGKFPGITDKDQAFDELCGMMYDCGLLEPEDVMNDYPAYCLSLAEHHKNAGNYGRALEFKMKAGLYLR